MTLQGQKKQIILKWDDVKFYVLMLFVYCLVDAVINGWHLFVAFRQNIGPQDTISWVVNIKQIAVTYAIYTRTQLEWIVGLQSVVAVLSGAILGLEGVSQLKPYDKW